MQVELATWRPLWDFAAVLFALGIAGGICSRDRTSWWVSQGLLLLGVLVGFAAASLTHTGVDLFTLVIWVPIAWALNLIVSFRIPKSSAVSHTNHDRSL